MSQPRPLPTGVPPPGWSKERAGLVRPGEEGEYEAFRVGLCIGGALGIAFTLLVLWLVGGLA